MSVQWTPEEEQIARKAAATGLRVVYEMQLMIPFFPKGEDASDIVRRHLFRMAVNPETGLPDPDRLDWIGAEAIKTLRQWEGIPCLKNINERYDRKDESDYERTTGS